MVVLQGLRCPGGDKQNLVLAQDFLGVGDLADRSLHRQGHDVVFLDGIWLTRKAVVLLAVADGRVVGPIMIVRSILL